MTESPVTMKPGRSISMKIDYDLDKQIKKRLRVFLKNTGPQKMTISWPDGNVYTFTGVVVYRWWQRVWDFVLRKNERTVVVTFLSEPLLEAE